MKFFIQSGKNFLIRRSDLLMATVALGILALYYIALFLLRKRPLFDFGITIEKA